MSAVCTAGTRVLSLDDSLVPCVTSGTAGDAAFLTVVLDSPFHTFPYDADGRDMHAGEGVDRQLRGRSVSGAARVARRREAAVSTRAD
jgi:hypothetical protein